jgi:hypothetical protein
MSDTEITIDQLESTMALAKQMGDVLNGHPLYIGLSALTMLMAHLLVANEHVAPAERAATLANAQLRDAIELFRKMEANHVTH